MSSILKEPYQISVWEDELVPEIVEYYKEIEEGKIETITSEEYNNLLSDEEKQQYTQKIIREHFEESRGLIIGANDMDSPYAAVNSSLKTNVNGSANLTFTMYYKVFDPDVMDFVINPLTAAVLNERKIKLHFRDRWYDMVIKNCVEDSTAYSFTYTCSDIYINELSKNGFKVELDTELENNQGTVTKVAETILEGTDWHVAPIEEEAPKDYEGPYSDVIVQTNIEPIYQGILNQTIEVEPVNDFTPDEYADMSDQDGYITDEETNKKTKTSFTISKGEIVFMFYSDITKNAEQPQILYRKGVELPEDLTDKEELNAALQEVYARDVNEDIITNAYNYRIISPEVLYVDKASSYDVPNIFYSENDSSFEICDWARGEKVIRSTKTGYDPDLDQFITVYKKYNEETDNYDYYYGYTTLDSISSDLAMNYLANSDNFIGIDTGWIFDGTPTTMDDAGDGTTVTGTNPNSEDATFTGQIYLLNQKGFSYDAANEGGAESVLIMKLEDGDDEYYYRDNNGDFYKITEVVAKNDGTTDTETKEQYIKLGSPKAESYEAQIAAEYERLRTKGDERFASMSDDELQRTVDGALRNARYSTRIRRAVNTGIAANRKQIENFSESEEYIFAVSLGQYKEGDPIPEYGDEIKYGAKMPTELYTFEDVTDSEAILKKVREEAYTQAVAEIKNHPTRFLNTDEYGNITDEIYLKVYNDYLAEKEAEYTAIYLDDFGLLKNLMHGDTIDKNERGGKRFREVFKNNLLSDGSYVDENGEIQFEEDSPERFVNKTISLLNDCKNFDTEQIYVKEVEEPFTTIVVNGKEVTVTRKVFTTITQKEYDDITDENLKKEYTEKTLSFAQQLYEGLKTAFFSYGWAPAELAKQKAEADANSFEWFFIENSWEQSGNDGTFPEYKEDSLMFTDESEINCFCDMLYVELVKTIYDRYITATFDTDNDGTLDDPTITVIIPTQGEIMQIVDDVFEELVDRVGLIGALKAAYEYKKPSILNSKGGDKYQQHRARWEKDGHEVALYAAFHSEPFASKYSYGTPELDKNGKVVQDDKKTTDKNEFGGLPELAYLTEIEKLRIEAKKELDEKSSPAYIGTTDYYKVLDTKYFDLQKNYDDTTNIYYISTIDEETGEEIKSDYITGAQYKALSEEDKKKYTKEDYLCGWGFTSLYLKYKEAEFNEAAQVATFTISREEYPLNSLDGGEMTSPIIPKQDEDGNWIINNTYETTAEGAKYFAYEDDVNGYYVFDKETESICLYNPTKHREKPTYLPIKDNEGGNYIYDEEREVYRRYRGWLSTEYRDPKTGEYLPQIQGGLAGDIVRHDMAWFDGHIGEWDEIPTRYQMVRTYEDEEDRLYLNEDVKVEWTVQAIPTGWQKFCEVMDFDSDFEVDTRYYNVFKTYAAGYQLDHFYEDEDGYYVRINSNTTNKFEEFNDKVKSFFDELGDKIEDNWDDFLDWLGFGEVKEEQLATFSAEPIETDSKILNALLWGYNNLIVPVVNLTEEGIKKINEFAEDKKGNFAGLVEERSFTRFTNLILPLAEKLGIKVSEIGIFSSNKDVNESTYFENSPYFIDLSSIYNTNKGEQEGNLPEGLYIPNFNNGEALVKAIQSGAWEYRDMGEKNPQPVISLMDEVETDQSTTFYPLSDNMFHISKGQTESKDYKIHDSGSVQYVKYRWWNWRHWGKKRYNLKEKLCVPAKNGSLDEFKVYNSVRDGASKNYSVVPVDEKSNRVKYTILDKQTATNIVVSKFNEATGAFWDIIKEKINDDYWKEVEPLIYEHELEKVEWYKRDWDILGNLSISYLVKYRFCIATGACWGIYKNGYVISLPRNEIPGFDNFEDKKITTDIYMEQIKNLIQGEKLDPSEQNSPSRYSYTAPNPTPLASTQFQIREASEINEGFYLKEKTIAYRTLQESDFEPDTYFMWYDEKIEDTHYTYNSYLNYFKPYDKKDREIELGDGHFGLWVQTFTPIPALNQPLETKVIQVFDEHGVFLRYLGENESPNDGEIVKEATYDSTWLPVDNILIPYEKRLYNAGKRHFRRVRSTSSYSSFTDWDLDNLFTYCNGEYMSLREYYEKNTKINHLNYDGLKVYFTPHYEYNPEHFSLEINQEPYDEYLGLQISTEPEGYFDTTVLNNTIIEEEVKERWGYWKIGVNKGYSLTDDLLSSIGIVFEKAKDAKRPLDKNGNDEDFAFLGMQLFRYIPYRSNKREEEVTIVESGTLTFTKSIETGYWDLVPSGDKLEELKEDIVLPEVKDDIPIDVNLELAAKEFFDYLSEGIEKTEYIISYLDAYEADNTQEFIFEYILEKVSLIEERRPIIPGEAPDARDLTLTEYYIYDPEREENDKPETAIFDYKGQYPEEAGYEVVYDELCQKIRSIKGKEQNYFKLLQDCCDTFDCWMEVIVDHDPETGRVEYEERKVYTKISDEVDPQQYFDALPEGEEETDYTVEYMIVPKKTIRFKRFVGKENWSGFKYGVNLKHIKRTLDSNQIATRIIVKPNKNEFATDGFCTIQRADENFIKENFIYDFSYYINKKMLDYGQVLQDLYTDVGSNLGYYRKLGRLNKENDQLIIDIASVIVELDKVNADYETAVLGRDAANEEIQKLMQILASNYDTYGNIQFVPWEYNRAKEYEQKTSTTAPERPGVQIVDAEGKTYTVNIPKTTTELEYPKYNETLRTYFDQMDTYMRSHINFSKQVEEFGKRKQELEEKRDKLLALEQEIIVKKKELNKIFFIKYARFIQEGSWIDEKYMDDNLYYLDSLAVLRNSCSPKVTYDIGVIDLYAAVEFEEDRPVLEFELGDRTYVEDVEFFGYTKNDKPYQEQIVISEKIYMLDDASQNQIKVKNYSTQFDNLFQRAAAATQTLQFNEGSYGRASTILNSDGTINQNVLQQSVSDANLILANSLNENVLWDNTGITVTSYSQRSNVIKIVSAGIMLSKDGGNSYLTAITGDGVNAAVITGGMLNVDKLMIGASSTPNFLWNRAGISAFKTSDEGIDYSTFVRLDQYGVYGIKDWSKNDTPIDKMTINDTFEPLKLEDITNNNNAIFGLTWDGFFLNTVTEQGRGRVTIGTNQDFRMSVFDEDIGWQDRVIIGSMSDILTGEKTYGFRLVNADGEIVMDTNLRGELYLKRKLRISNFANETSYNPGLYYDENGNVQYNPEQVYSSNTDDRVTLGIVDIYERTGEGIFTPAEPEGVYKSSQYLTKVLSIKVNDIIGNEPFTQEQIDQLIASNETFAIFDNGNLYAKNAWIEGHIQATSGYFRNVDIFGELKVGKEDNTENIGRIFQADGNWSINGDGTAFFKNAIVSGKISTAIFEKQKIQTVGGSLIVAPQLTVKDVEHIEGSFYKIICEETTTDGKPTSDFSDGSICKIGNTTGQDAIFRMSWEKLPKQPQIDLNGNLDGLETEADSDKKEEKNIVFYAEILNNGSIKENEQLFVFCLNKNQNDNLMPTIMLGLNGGDNSSTLPEEGFSIFENNFDSESNTYSTNVKAKIGKLGIEVPSALQGTYGLYSDNAYLKGTLITQNNNTEAGVSTNNYKVVDNKNLVFWAGDSLGINFSVTDDGTLLAKKGIFEGEVRASLIQSSEIKTSKVTGFDFTSGTTGLIFDGNGSAIRFINREQELFNLSTDGIKQTIDLKIFNDLQNAPLTFGILNQEQIIGLFGSATANTVNDFGMSIKQNEQNEVEIYHKGMLQMTLSSLGVSFGTNQQNASLGEKVYSLDSINGGINIGCDIYVES